MSVNYTEFEQNMRELASNINIDTFAYDLLAAAGAPKSFVTLLKRRVETTSHVRAKGKFLFMRKESGLSAELDRVEIKPLAKEKIRFVIVTDGDNLEAMDIKTGERIISRLSEINLDFEFFLPLAGIEKYEGVEEAEADAKAALKMAKLFDTLRVNNPVETEQEAKAMNVFLSRLLFCLFAEDTGIFEKDAFTKYVANQTSADGSNVSAELMSLFANLDNTEWNKKKGYTGPFDYVNGGLFAEKLPVPHFTPRARNTLIECGQLDWANINPDIFGSMIQAVVDTQYRGNMGMHYTSVPNIMKVLSPLFLDEIKEEYARVLITYSDARKISALRKLVTRLSQIKVGDMACGSGNFLIIAYKEMRELEMKILTTIQRLEGSENQLDLAMGAPVSGISLGQFYGIEYDEFAASIAELSMWLAEHQMNQQFKERFGECSPTLPLKSFKTIIHGNSLRIDWSKHMPNDGECYIVGNPPFLGSSMQTKEQKEDMAFVFEGFKKYKNLDYVSAWFLKGKNYLKNSHAKCAFVSTNSICQGDSVGLLWEGILSSGVEIGFAHTEFKWNNSAKNKAAVMCVIVGLQNEEKGDKKLFSQESVKITKKINAYLSEGSADIVKASSTKTHDLGEMIRPSAATDGGYLILNTDEKDRLIEENPQAEKFVRKYIGAAELINNKERWCLWIEDEDLAIAESIEEIKQRIDRVSEYRIKSPSKSTQNWAKMGHSFVKGDSFKSEIAMLIPVVTSEKREYLPIGIINEHSVCAAPNFVIYNPEDYVFAVLVSKMHMAWVKAVGGRLKSDIRYSNTLCYNTYPVPELTDENKAELKRLARAVIVERIMLGGSLAELYDPKKMPASLRAIHNELDAYIDELYRKAAGRPEPIQNDNDRLEVLFKLYAGKVGK